MAMRARFTFAALALALAVAVGTAVLRADAASSARPAGDGEVLLCDGETKVSYDAEAPPTRDSAQAIANELMREWKKKHPDRDWEADERAQHMLVPSTDNSGLVGTSQGTTYGQITSRDVELWKVETERMAVSGSKVFHSGDELGSQIAVSCDMCHPDASNTHPETYPKFQVQLGRTVLLRDMINWCIEHPVRGKVLAADDPKMRALEAYIYAQRKGVPLSYGKR
jgi:cytochrome c553